MDRAHPLRDALKRYSNLTNGCPVLHGIIERLGHDLALELAGVNIVLLHFCATGWCGRY